MVTQQESITSADQAGLQNLHRLATERYVRVVDELVALENKLAASSYTDEQANALTLLRCDREAQHAFVLQLNTLLYEAGVQPLA
jgi:hypothetical protein